MSKSPLQLAQEYIQAYKTQEITAHTLWEALDGLASYERDCINLAYQEGRIDQLKEVHQPHYFDWRYGENM
jgi:hypothetical protein